MADHQQALAALAAKIDAIEAEMRRIGYWADTPPDLLAEYEAGRMNTYLDAPSFELWLQCVFIPNARDAVNADDLPGGSDVGLMAMRQYDYHSHVPEAQNLLAMLNEFDRLVKKANRKH